MVYPQRRDGNIVGFSKWPSESTSDTAIDEDSAEFQAFKNPPATAKETATAAKLAGVKLGTIMASATRDDRDGLTAIAMGVMMKRAVGKTFPDTVFEFVNGEKLLITDANFDGYFATWSAFRQKFFAPKGL